MLSYEEWIKEADRLCSRLIGVGVYDMEDYLWRDSYESGASPIEGLEGAIDYWSEWDPMFRDLVENAGLYDRLEELSAELGES